MTRQLVIFTDLDGCLLNKHDYSWDDAATCLRRLHDLTVPVVLSSSKTVAEMAVLADELPIDSFPFVAENGGVVCWRSAGQGGLEDNTINGARREDILNLLQSLKPRFQFRSFNDLGLSGVMTHTDLSEAAARRACDRHTTEPLLWDNSESQRLEFQEILDQSGFTFTRGCLLYTSPSPRD